jgi:branched-chain amino acid transport system permease protein
MAMVLSGFFAGVGGSVYALYLGFINADNILGLAIGLFPVVSAITGGTGIFLGPLVGNFVLTGINLTVPSIVVAINPSAIVGPLVVTGVLLILVGLFVPSGLLTLHIFEQQAYRRVDSRITRVLRRRTEPLSST